MEINVKSNDELIKESKQSKIWCIAYWLVGCFCIMFGFVSKLDILYWVGITQLFVAQLYALILFSNVIRLEIRGTKE